MLNSSRSGVFLTFALLRFCLPAHAEDAAPSYYLAILELNQSHPDYVDFATTDHPSLGFAARMSEKQNSYLKEPSVLSALSRFDEASSCDTCDWRRYKDSTWSDANLNSHLHRLARITLLRARQHYECGEWKSGNRDVERVRIMARRMTLQARPGENYCFMIENMAMGTAAAYILRMPVDALGDLAQGHSRVGNFEPMSKMLLAEVARLSLLAENHDAGRVTLDTFLGCMDTYLSDDQQKSNLAAVSKGNSVVVLRQFSAFMEELALLMNRRDREVEAEIKKLADRHARNIGFLSGLEDRGLYLYRENAQAVCRGIMFREIIDQAMKGGKDFSNIPDPFGKNVLTLCKSGSGLKLQSELVYFSQIDFMFGIAGTENKEH